MSPDKCSQNSNYRPALFRRRLSSNSLQRIDSTNTHIYLFIPKLTHSLREPVGKLRLLSDPRHILCHFQIVLRDSQGPLRYLDRVPGCEETKKDKDTANDLSQSRSGVIF